MTEADMRWKQRFANYQKAFPQLTEAVALAKQRPLSEQERQGRIQAFEFTHELAWNVFRDYYRYQDNPAITGSRDASREAFAKGLIGEGQVWMDMIRDRYLTSHTYQEAVAARIAQDIVEGYQAQFSALEVFSGFPFSFHSSTVHLAPC